MIPDAAIRQRHLSGLRGTVGSSVAQAKVGGITYFILFFFFPVLSGQAHHSPLKRSVSLTPPMNVPNQPLGHGWMSHEDLRARGPQSPPPLLTLPALHLQLHSGLTFCISGNPNRDTPSAEMFMQLTTISGNHLLLLVMLPWSGASPFT